MTRVALLYPRINLHLIRASFLILASVVNTYVEPAKWVLAIVALALTWILRQRTQGMDVALRQILRKTA